MNYHRKLGIFIGSTKRDFSGPRLAIIEAVLQMGHIPCGMEIWPASSGVTQKVIEHHLSHCDIHILLVGAEYGSEIPEPTAVEDKGISFTEWEYKLSKKAERPIIAFLLEQGEFDANLEKKLAQLPAGSDAWKAEEETQGKLKKFRDRLKTKPVRFFSEHNNGHGKLVSDCIASLSYEIGIRDLSSGGWIHAKSDLGQRLTAIESNDFLRDILDRIFLFSDLKKRLDEEPELKKTMGRVFWDLMIGRIKRKKLFRVFFESGSTIAHVTHAFEQKLHASEGDRQTEWEICTNNAISLLQLLLHTRLRVRPLPAGVPENRYGAMFNDELIRNPEAPPQAVRSLYPNESTAIDNTVELLKGGCQDGIFLMTASGFETNKDSQFHGPHIGSHPNMLFKQALLKTGRPIVLFLTEDKIGKAFVSGKCYPVCMPPNSWKEICQTAALAVCVSYKSHGYKNNARRALIERIKPHFPSIDFEYAHGTGDECGVIIGANPHFAQILDRE